MSQDIIEAPSQPIPRTSIRRARKQPYGLFHYVLMVYLFFYCSRIPELVPGAHFSLVLSPILLVGLFMTGRTMVITRTRAGRVLIGFVAWMAICVPFSSWRGGSAKMFILTVQAVFLAAFMVAFIQTVRDAMRTIHVIGLAMGAAAFLSLGVGTLRGERLGLGGAGNVLADPNTMCLYLLVGMPFLLLTAELSSGFKRYLSLVLIFPILAAAARTGSRAGLVFGAVGLIFFLVHATIKQRVAVVLGSILLLMVCVNFLPKSVLDRYFLYFQPRAEYTEGSEAVASAEARKYLLKRSLVMTAQNPIFGVGPGQFMTDEASMSKEEGVRASWHVSHNSYTEVSSEMGIPGAILFIASIVAAYQGLTRLRKRDPYRQIRRMALYSQMALLMMAVGAVFLSLAYSGLLYPLLGLSMALPLAARDYSLASRPQES